MLLPFFTETKDEKLMHTTMYVNKQVYSTYHICSELILSLLSQSIKYRTGKLCKLRTNRHSYLTQKYSLKQPKSSNFIHSILPVSYNQLTNTGSYSLILTEEGGIVDDCILTKWSDESWYLVTNAARSKEVANWLTNQQERYQDETGESISIDYLESKKQALLALQGPKAAEVLARHSETSLKELYFGNVSQNLRLSGGANVHIARSGYTGEDGFEISVEERDAVAIADMLADGNPTIPIGLGARDSLRLEAGLCLYGNVSNVFLFI